MKKLYIVSYEPDTHRFMMWGDGGEFEIDNVDIEGGTTREMAHALKFDAEHNIEDARVRMSDCMEAIRSWIRN